jgi:structural maintenance of chromosome 3 (chondroitin sulfate proteoglycan 6)
MFFFVQGLDAVRQIASDLRIDGYHGPVIDLFSCAEHYHTAVEITAGNSLFHVVVETDAIATKLIQELNKRKAGRVTFVPLNRINPDHPKYPALSRDEAVPMIEQLQYDKRFEKAMLQIFAKTLIARDLKIAAHLALEHNLNTITINGDRVDKKGALTGGSVEFHLRSRLQAQADIRLQSEKLQEVQSELDGIKKELKGKKRELSCSHLIFFLI